MGFAPFKQPDWIHPHLQKHKKLSAFSSTELYSLRQKLAIYKADKPELSIVIPAYNEENYLAGALSSLAELKLPHIYPTELWVINDASTDNTQKLLEQLDVKSIHLPANLRPKGARQKGLEVARGKILLQADADTLYPPGWGLDFVEKLNNPEISAVYGSHAFYSHSGTARLSFVLHESIGALLYAIRRRNRPYLNAFGFNMAFYRQTAQKHGSYDHSPLGSEDGHMALMLMKMGSLAFLPGKQNRAWTSDRRIMADGGMWKAFLKRARREGRRLGEYIQS